MKNQLLLTYLYTSLNEKNFAIALSSCCYGSVYVRSLQTYRQR